MLEYLSLIRIEEYMKDYLKLNKYLIMNNSIVRINSNEDSMNRSNLTIMSLDRKIALSSQEYCSNLGSTMIIIYIYD
jgi:hypothetical protein